MAAPKTPAPRTLSPGVPVVSYPTPKTSDLLVVLDIDTRLPSFVPQTYGDPHPDPFLYPNHKLVYQVPLDNENNHMWLRRVYAANRSEQDDYNYAIKYLSSDPNYPTYIRTYVVPRAEYEPLEKGSTDPLFPTSPSGNSVVLNSEEVERFKGDSSDDSQLDSLFVKVTRVYITLPGPTIVGGQIDSRFGIPVVVEKQPVPAGTLPSLTRDPDTGEIRSSDIDPVDSTQSTRLTSVLPALPEPQVWYGRRYVTELPPVLTSAELVGTEQLAFVPNYEEVPSSPLKARYTRTFTYGPPTEESVSGAALLQPLSYNVVVEYSSSRESFNNSSSSGSSSSSSASASASSQSGASSSAQSGASASASTGSSASSSTSSSASSQSSTSASNQSGANASSQTGSSTSSQAGSSTSSQSGVSASSQVGSSASSQVGSSASSQVSSSSGSSVGSSSSSQTNSSASSGSNSSASSGANTSSGASSHSTSTSQGDESGHSGQNRDVSWSHDGPGAILTSDPAHSSAQNSYGSSAGRALSLGLGKGLTKGSGKSLSTGKGTSTSKGSSTSTSSGQSASTSLSLNSSTSSSKNSSLSSGKSSSISSGKTSSTSSGTSSSRSSGLSASTSSGKSLGTSVGTGISTSTSKSSSTASGRNSSTTAGQSSSTSVGTSNSIGTSLGRSTSVGLSSSLSTSHSRSTSKSLLSVQVPRCLREETQLSADLVVNGDTVTVSATIPATNPTTLPWNSWVEVGTRSSEYWKYGVWVTEKVEVYLERPTAP